MALEFKMKDFFHPGVIGRWASFRRSQWYTPEDLEKLQTERLKNVLRQAATQVPYYRDLFKHLKLTPEDFRRPDDLRALPLLTKDMIRDLGPKLWADDRARYGAMPVTTSGSTGLKLTVLMDRPANALEFNYYLRLWGWFGYRLGLPFAEFSSASFQKRADRHEIPWIKSKLTNRLLLNSLELSEARTRQHVEAIRTHGSRYLKGLPSVIYHFALMVQRLGFTDVRFRAVFSQGEFLLPSQRRVIAETFGCPVVDSYGHMERTVAIAECEHGRLHQIDDYGLLQTEVTADDPSVSRVIGTGLYNMSMPLIRYEVGDRIKPGTKANLCACGRGFQPVEALLGRQSSVILTPDGKVITAAFLVFEDFDTIVQGTLTQPAIGQVVARVVPGPGFDASQEKALAERLRDLVGPSSTVRIERLGSVEDLRGSSGKVL